MAQRKVYDARTGREKRATKAREELRRRIERARGVTRLTDDSPERRVERAGIREVAHDGGASNILVERANGEETWLLRGEKPLTKRDDGLFRVGYGDVFSQPAWTGTRYDD